MSEMTSEGNQACCSGRTTDRVKPLEFFSHLVLRSLSLLGGTINQDRYFRDRPDTKESLRVCMPSETLGTKEIKIRLKKLIFHVSQRG